MDEGKGEMEMSVIHSVNDGFVRLVDSMGNDMSVVRAARVSYGNDNLVDEDYDLLLSLMKDNDKLPFEHMVFTFHIRCPILIAQQWLKHQIGSFNEGDSLNVELSRDLPRLTLLLERFSEEEIASMQVAWEYATEIIESTYDSLLEKGMVEQAKAILPLGTHTEFYWTVNLHHLFNFITLQHNYAEMQDYLVAIQSIGKEKAKLCFQAFESEL